MKYLKTSEISNWVTRNPVPSGSELKLILVACRLADAYCRRPLAISHYRKSRRLSAAGVGFLGVKPFIQFAPVETVTGLRVFPKYRTRQGGYVKASVAPLDIQIPANLRELIDTKNGMIELPMVRDLSDYGRELLGPVHAAHSYVQAWEADVEFYAGYFVETAVKTAASSGASAVELNSVVGITANKTYLTFKDDAKAYRVTGITGTTVQLHTPLTTALAVDDEVAERVPEEVKAAIGCIIEDRLTWGVNTNRLSEELANLLKTRISRINDDALPVDAQELLKDYRNSA